MKDFDRRKALRRQWRDEFVQADLAWMRKRHDPARAADELDDLGRRHATSCDERPLQNAFAIECDAHVSQLVEHLRDAAHAVLALRRQERRQFRIVWIEKVA